MDEGYLKTKMKQAALIGGAVGIALFGVAWMSYHTLFHAIVIPIAALVGYYTPKLLAGDGDYDD